MDSATTTGHSATSRRPNIEAQTIGLAEFAKRLGVGYAVAHELAQRGELPIQPIRVGRRYLFPRTQIDRLLGLTGDGE